MSFDYDKYPLMFDENDNVVLNDVTLEFIEDRYTSDPIPPCRVCGAELSIQRMGGGEATTWGHSKPNDGVTTFGEWMDHYSQSKYIERKSGDSFVLKLLAAYKELASENKS
jgi:hypothetical protein